MNGTYRWKQVWAIQTGADDPITPGDVITVDSSKGSSKQQVVSVTEMTNLRGDPYRTVLVQEVK